MSRSSTREAPSGERAAGREPSALPADRGAVEPTVALVAVFAVCAGLGLYATVLDDAVAAAGGDRDRAGPAADRLVDAISTAGIADPERLREAVAALPGERRRNATLVTATTREGAGPPAPWVQADGTAPNAVADSTAPASADASDFDVETRLVSVRLGPGEVVPGRLRVVVWA